MVKMNHASAPNSSARLTSNITQPLTAVVSRSELTDFTTFVFIGHFLSSYRSDITLIFLVKSFFLRPEHSREVGSKGSRASGSVRQKRGQVRALQSRSAAVPSRSTSERRRATSSSTLPLPNEAA